MRISSAAAVNLAAEADLVETAGTAICAACVTSAAKPGPPRVLDPEATNRRIHASRFFRYGYDAEAVSPGRSGSPPVGGEVRVAPRPVP